MTDPDSGAGLVMHINRYATQSIQKVLEPKRDDMLKFKNPYAVHFRFEYSGLPPTHVSVNFSRSAFSFIMMDILNCDQATLERIRRLLGYAKTFHETFREEKRMRLGLAADSCPTMNPYISRRLCRWQLPQLGPFLDPIPSKQWQAMLASLDRTLFFERVDTLYGGRLAQSYTSAVIVHEVPTSRKSSTGVPTNGGSGALKPSAIVNGDNTPTVCTELMIGRKNLLSSRPHRISSRQ